MKIKQDGWHIVIAGLWNRALFTPEWMERVLFPKQKVETLLSIMPYLPIIYRNDQVAVEVSTPRVVFRPRRVDDQSIQAAEQMAHVVLGKLQDTPLMGVGVNFAFVEDTPRADIVDLLRFADDASVTGNGWAIQERRLVRRMQQGDDVLNMALVYDNENLTIEFNFHTETTSSETANETARNAVDNRVLRLRGMALQLLNDVYNLSPSEGEEDHG